MSDETVRLHLEAAYDSALRHLRAFWKAERACELDDRIYKRYDGRGFHAVSLEVGRLFALAELCPELSEHLDLAVERRNARDLATRQWREKTFEAFAEGAVSGGPVGDAQERPGIAPSADKAEAA